MFVNLGNLSALRTFRVLRALKTVAIVPGECGGDSSEELTRSSNFFVLEREKDTTKEFRGKLIHWILSNKTNAFAFLFHRSEDHRRRPYRICKKSTGCDNFDYVLSVSVRLVRTTNIYGSFDSEMRSNTSKRFKRFGVVRLHPQRK